MNDDTTDYSGQQNNKSDRGFITIIYLLILFILVNEVAIEWGYRA